MKSTILQSPPKHYAFLNERAKRGALENVRNMEIEKENHSLVGKIRNIGEKGSKSCQMWFSNGFEKKKSLNQDYRKRELVKIVEENQEILKRIESKKSQYNVRKWGKERKQIEKNISLISSYQYKDYAPTQTKVNLWMTDTKVSLIKKEASEVLTKCDLFFRGTQRIGENYYLIETNVENKTFEIHIENLEFMEEKYKLQMSEKEVAELLQKHFEGSLEIMLDNLAINENEGTCEIKCGDQKKCF